MSGKQLSPFSYGQVIVVQERSNPSTDYFILPFLKSIAASVRIVNHSDVLVRADLQGAAVVFVRYVPERWARLVSRHRDVIADIAYFMDDDLFDWLSVSRMPWRYGLKLARLATARQFWLRRMGARLWISNAYLEKKYRAWEPARVEPRPLSGTGGGNMPVRIFYHGTASHDAEIRWLRPIIAEVLQKAPHASFEIVGSAMVNRLYRHLPRVTVVHPMSWENYRSFCEAGERHIGLSPLLDSPFNAARSHTKFFDILRCGAIGVYSDKPPFSDFIRNGKDGLLVENQSSAWVSAILGLIEQPKWCEQMLDAARCRLNGLNRS